MSSVGINGTVTGCVRVDGRIKIIIAASCRNKFFIEIKLQISHRNAKVPLYRGISILVCLVCLSRLWCAVTMFTKYCGSRTLENLSSLCTKLILNRGNIWDYLPMPELEIIYPICAKGCRKIRDAKFLEDIRYAECV